VCSSAPTEHASCGLHPRQSDSLHTAVIVAKIPDVHLTLFSDSIELTDDGFGPRLNEKQRPTSLVVLSQASQG
jgi:hypothetical protein